MNSTFLRILAILMVIAAVVTAYVGYRLSQKKPAASVAVVMPSYTQVIAKNTLAAGHVLVMEDLETATTPHFDSHAFNDTQALVGKAMATPIIKGAPFNASHFPVHSALGQALAANERAVAIKVNEVIGVGGFIKPGDRVDVLLYLRQERETGEVSSAQVVLTNVKVLAYGTLTAETEASQDAALTPSAPGKLGTGSRSDKNAKESRSAILAVPAHEMAKLMLADSTGSLRLALRGEALPDTSTTAPAQNQLIRLGEVSQASAARPVAVSQVTVNKAPASPAPKQARVIVHRGEKTEVIDVAK
ncbi:MAG: Flp pilus assembly protein CpaB [Methylophilus sp.]|uniref:Flp pilus assembly protein CpaB n=1 Tax=Methylophilus sp. TaxID=29541 RepID=UPI003F9FD307